MGVGQPELLESMIPFWGSGRSAVDHFQNGNYWRATGYTLLAVSDVFLVKALFTGIAKGGLKALGKSYTHWGSYRSFYGKQGFAESGQHLHHWAWPRNGATSGSGFNWWAKNQMWNLMPMKNPSFHARFGHGNYFKGIPSGSLGQQFWYGTPHWFKVGTISVGGRVGLGNLEE